MASRKKHSFLEIRMNEKEKRGKEKERRNLEYITRSEALELSNN